MQPAMQPADDDSNVFELTREALDDLPYGVITLDRSGMILRFNRSQVSLSRREAKQNVGLSFFNDVAPCTNVQAFRGRFDEFAARYDSGSERFAFSFAFRWGRQDVVITMLRKAGHDDINVLIHGRALELAQQTPAPPAVAAPPAPVTVGTLARSAIAAPTVCALHRDNLKALARRVHPDDLFTVTSIVAAAARENRAYAAEYRGVDADAVRIFRETGYFDADPQAICRATIVDVTHERKSHEQTWRLAYYDGLTGLPNRQLLLERVGEAIRENTINGCMTAVIKTNISGFRETNETFGYETGDALLRAVALRLGECIQGGDTVSRVAADTFVVLLPVAESPESVGETAKKIIAAVSRPFNIEGRPHHVGLRVGISLSPYDSVEPARLLWTAEAAMEAAKGSGRNGLCFYSNELTAAGVKNREQQIELQAALEKNEFELLYQPLVDIHRDRVVATEALVRWNHPTRGVVSPLEFIPLADRTGLIIPLGEWVLRTACRQARQWADRGLDVRVCVNVSAVQFSSPQFVDLVAALIAEYELAPGRIELELTESIMVQGFTEMMEILTRLKALGVRLAIDDFGTGYSSLSYLKYFPIDTLKVDRAFIIDVVSDEFDQAISTVIFSLAKSLELECIVEGVETLDQLEMLASIGCTVVQGYYFCRPSRPDKLTDLLTASTVGAEQFVRGLAITG